MYTDKNMTWSDRQEPNADISYDHITCETPLGTAVVEWASWKESPGYGISLNGEYIDTCYSIDDAKARVFQYLQDITTQCMLFLSNT